MPDEHTRLLHGHYGDLRKKTRQSVHISLTTFIDIFCDLPENSHRSIRQTIRASLGTDAETQYARHADAARQPIYKIPYTQANTDRTEMLSIGTLTIIVRLIATSRLSYSLAAQHQRQAIDLGDLLLCIDLLVL